MCNKPGNSPTNSREYMHTHSYQLIHCDKKLRTTSPSQGLQEKAAFMRIYLQVYEIKSSFHLPTLM